MTGIGFDGRHLALLLALFLFLCQLVKYWTKRSKELQTIKNKLGEETISWILGEIK